MKKERGKDEVGGREGKEVGGKYKQPENVNF
jgi:hypothetical protein